MEPVGVWSYLFHEDHILLGHGILDVHCTNKLLLPWCWMSGSPPPRAEGPDTRGAGDVRGTLN